MTINHLYDLSQTIAKPLLEQAEYPWEVLPKIGAFILELGKNLSPEEYDQPGEGIWVHKTAKVAPTACLMAPIHQRLNAKAIFGAAMIDWEQGGVLNPLLFLPRKFFPADWFSCDILFQ